MSGNYNAAGEWDPNEPPFSNDEIEFAVHWRQSVKPDPRLKRRDQCPHTPMCVSVQDCIESIAWYKRHQRAIESRL